MPNQQNLKNLVKRYEDIKNLGKLKSYSEEQTKKDFILPLFEILGWDVYSKTEVSAEETISSERVDYGFYLNDRIKFYLEAKKFNVDIHDEKFANQAIKYSFNKGATWAVLTNFETLIVFNAQDIEGKLSDKRFFEINCSEFLERFEQLSLLSKESFKNDFLDKEAEKVGKKVQKISVSNLLYKDLQTCRDILTKDLSQWNNTVDPDLLDEGVQKLLDRLLFIRVAEDRGIEPQTLIPMVRQARENQGKHLYQSMTEKFREFDSFYNSNLFSEHPFEGWEEYSGATEKVVHILYGKEGYYEYDFKAMPADVLGTVYENYLSHRLSKSRKGTTVSKDAGKRKEQGIYYTPSYIVDYIVKNALGPVLDKCKTIEDIKKIKVLDPACGSGSFLIKAFEVIFEKYKEFGFRGLEDLLKIQILQENIYGVDLDQQAVEITRLNLLISALSKREKLPSLDNIKNGNSLVSGTDEELQKYFGKNFLDKKPFNWQEEFPEVFKQGGFDVIIGNPPWSSKIDSEDNKIIAKKFGWSEKNVNICALFINDAFEKLRLNGTLGFLLPKVVIKNTAYLDIRERILKEFHMSSIWDFGQFPGVASDSIGLIINKKKSDADTKIYFYDNYDLIGKNSINQKTYLKSSSFIFSLKLNPGIQKLLNKISNDSLELGELFKIKRGIELGQKSLLVKCLKCGSYNEAGVKYYAEVGEKKCKKCGSKLNLDEENTLQISSNKKDVRYVKKAIAGSQLQRFLIQDYYFIPKELEGIDYKLDAFSGNKILIKRIDTRPAGTFTDDDVLAFNTVYSIYNHDLPKNNFLFTLGILNSNIMGFFYEHSYNIGMNLTTQVTVDFLSKLPIKNIPSYKQEIVTKLVDKIINLNSEIQSIAENSEKWNSIKSEIEKADNKIDEEIHKLYGLTPEEIKIVGNNK